MKQEQINPSSSTNTVEMNFLKNLAHLLLSSYRNQPVKFWSNTGFLILSIVALATIRTDNGFIRSLSDDKTKHLIILYLDFVSALYIVGLILYLYWKISPIKKDLMLSGVITFLILISITTTLLLVPVYNGLRYFILPQMELTLGEFGSFFASITGLLAFLAVLYTANVADKRAKETIALAKEEAENNRIRAEIAEENYRLQAEETKNRNRKDSERTIFFQLLDLHTKKVESITFENSIGAKACKEYMDKANNCLGIYIVYKDILNLNSTESIELDVDYSHFYKELCEEILINGYYNIEYDQLERLQHKLKQYIKEYNLIMPRHYGHKEWSQVSYKKWINHVFLKRINDHRYQYEAIKYIAEVLYKEHGHILGHYFRNMNYVMKTINNFSEKKNYKELFTAQLSRCEIALAFFYAVSNRSNNKMIELLEDFDVFKDIYEEDITMLKLAKEKGIEPNIFIENILNEYKKDISNNNPQHSSSALAEIPSG